MMSEEEQNYSMFSSRILVDTIGDVTDDALKASKMKEVIGVLAGRFFNWGQRKSLFPLHLGIKCCALEMAAAGASRFDAERFGVFFRSSPRQCDVLLVNGPISKKFADPITRLWEQMPEPKWCIAMGECAISGGPYFQSYNILEGVDTIIPVDITFQAVHLAQKHLSMDSESYVKRLFVSGRCRAMLESMETYR
jgi:NADH-quinone oxidoreductase subunit B